MAENKLVIICGEEHLIISELSSFRYVETDKGATKVPFHCLEFKDVSTTTSNMNKAPEVVLSSLKNTKETLEKGNRPVWAKY